MMMSADVLVVCWRSVDIVAMTTDNVAPCGTALTLTVQSTSVSYTLVKQRHASELSYSSVGKWSDTLAAACVVAQCKTRVAPTVEVSVVTSDTEMLAASVVHLASSSSWQAHIIIIIIIIIIHHSSFSHSLLQSHHAVKQHYRLAQKTAQFFVRLNFIKY